MEETGKGNGSRRNGGKVLYVGNYTFDVAIREGVRIDEERKVFFIGAGNGKEIEIREDPLEKKTTDKNLADRNLTEILGCLEQIPTARLKLGGGGRNSLEEAVTMETTGGDLISLDMQVPEKLILDYMAKYKVESYFLNKRKRPVNIVVGGRENKMILKSPIEKNKPLTQHEETLIESIVKSCRRIVINSLKDESLTKCLMRLAREYGKEVGAVVTTSFDNYDFVREEIVPWATCVFNYDEIGTVFNPEHVSLGDENDRYDDALWGIGDALRIQEREGKRYSLYVTMGKNGVLAMGRDGQVYHIYLKNEEIKKKLEEIIRKREDSTNGAGDHFAAAVLKYEEEGREAPAAAIGAQIRAIVFIGYRGEIGASDFVVDPVDGERLERKYIRRYEGDAWREAAWMYLKEVKGTYADEGSAVLSRLLFEGMRKRVEQLRGVSLRSIPERLSSLISIPL